MPTSRSGRVERVSTRYSSNNSGLTWRKTGTSTWDFYLREKTWPATVRRIYPEDEFLSGTTRTVTSRLRNDSGFTHTNYTAPRTRDENISVLANYRVANVPTVPVLINREHMYNSIRAQIRGDGVNLAMIAGEYRQTAKLYRELVDLVRSRGQSLLKKHPRTGEYTGKQATKDASRAYLAFTYGIDPLARDMAQAMRNLRDVLNKPLFIEGVVQQKASKTISGTLTIASTISSSKANYTAKQDLYYRTRWRAYLRKTSAGQRFLVEHGFANLPALAWNLLPFSFVIDWWVNVGETIESLDNLALIEKLLVLDSESDRLAIMVEPVPGPDQSAGMGFAYDREDIRKGPREIGTISSFRYKKSWSARHAANGVALLRVLKR